MNIVIISDFNIAGQCTALMKAINEHSEHKARCIILNDDHFAYDYDILLSKDTLEEAQYLCNEWANFYHFGSYLFNFPGVDFNKLIDKNCCIKYYGSYLRDNYQRCQEFHFKTGIAAITGTDFTITGRLPNSYYHLGSYFVKYGNMPLAEIPHCEMYYGNETFRVCAGSAGHPNKGYSILQQAIKELQAEGHDIELDLISGISNKEALERKRLAHACFCSLNGGWGISGVESMFLGQPTLTLLDPFVLSLYPDQPSIIVTKDNLKQKIALLEGHPEIWSDKSRQSKNFALNNFQWGIIIPKYLYLIDLIMNRDKYLLGGNAPQFIYKGE